MRHYRQQNDLARSTIIATTSVSARYQELFPETNLISLLTRCGGDAGDIFETLQDQYDAHEQEPLVGLLGIKAANIDAFARAAYWDLVSDIRIRYLSSLPRSEAAAIAAAADGLITHPEKDDIGWTPDDFVSVWNDLHRGEAPL